MREFDINPKKFYTHPMSFFSLNYDLHKIKLYILTQIWTKGAYSIYFRQMAQESFGGSTLRDLHPSPISITNNRYIYI
jgi:hypothetical protein